MLKTLVFRYCAPLFFAVPLHREFKPRCEDRLHLSIERALCIRFALSLSAEIKNGKMRTTTAIPTALQVLMNHIYELHKGVRHMVLFTCNNKYGEQVVSRLESQGIPYILQPAGRQNVNVYFGRRECLEAIRLFVTRPLHQLTPEEDFILGAMLGYDICAQCERYCKRKDECNGKCINRN